MQVHEVKNFKKGTEILKKWKVFVKDGVEPINEGNIPLSRKSAAFLFRNDFDIDTMPILCKEKGGALDDSDFKKTRKGFVYLANKDYKTLELMS